MLPTTLVTLATFLLELCSSSPVYNMQPAFIINAVGATTGRNIRNLPCISRKNNNQSGVCMFAIDCLKANGTHLGTCIDRFYFGSCCHIEPVHEILDNSIDTDILPHREPPLRVSSTTTKTTTNKFNTESSSLVSIINKVGIPLTTTSTTQKISTVTTTLPPSTVAIFGEKLTTKRTSSTTEASTMPQKLQTFQVIDGSTLIDTTTKASTTLATTKAPTRLTTTKIVTSKTTTSKPVSVVTKSPPIKSTTLKTTSKPKPSKSSSTTVKPTRVTKPPATKLTQKPTKATSKPVRTTTTTRKPHVTTKIPTTTVKITKPTRISTKPTKITTSPKPATTTTRVKSTTVKSTTTKATTSNPTTVQSLVAINLTTTTPTISSSTGSTQANPELVEITLALTRKPTEVTTKQPLSTTVSNEVPVNKINSSVILETVNGNLATNEIETGKPSVPVKPSEEMEPTGKPGIVTWEVADQKNHTTPTYDTVGNVTTEDWIPITTPDGWVLLPSVSPIIPAVQETASPPPLSSSSLSPLTSEETPMPTSTISISSSTSSPTTASTSSPTFLGTATEARPSVTYIPLEETTASINITTNDTSESVDTEKPITSTITTEMSVMENVSATTEAFDRPINMSDYTDVCGRRMYPEARIVGGEKAPFGKWPWQISLRQWRTSTYLHKCGAALLNENWAITAAHCVDNVPPSDLLLRLGEHDLSNEAEPYLHQERRVQIVASHPQFDPRTFEYDLALLRFYEPVTFQPNILPVCVPQTDENFVGRTAYVTGWGRLYEDGPLPSVLQEVSVPVINNTVCESMYRAAGYIEHIPHIFICAGWRRGGFDSCEGDSGGPMVIQRDDKRFLLAGIISWGIGCAEPNQPGVYTRISEFRDWINQILQF